MKRKARPPLSVMREDDPLELRADDEEESIGAILVGEEDEPTALCGDGRARMTTIRLDAEVGALDEEGFCGPILLGEEEGEATALWWNGCARTRTTAACLRKIKWQARETGSCYC